MTTAIDTNVLVALWDSDNALNLAAQGALDAALDRGSLLISAPVFAELLAFPSRGEAFLDSFLRDTGIRVDWELNESIWRTAGHAFQVYAARRRKKRDEGPRRILADFLIGAHALRHAYTLLTLDAKLYRSAFPHLRITAI
ncbi:MAG: type II toxin-antitoxin system VapC family toxin [Candidatus Acidiferrum sp.]|jgi:predicted nucleic acid-binding protein